MWNVFTQNKNISLMQLPHLQWQQKHLEIWPISIVVSFKTQEINYLLIIDNLFNPIDVLLKEHVWLSICNLNQPVESGGALGFRCWRVRLLWVTPETRTRSSPPAPAGGSPLCSTSMTYRNALKNSGEPSSFVAPWWPTLVKHEPNAWRCFPPTSVTY